MVTPELEAVLTLAREAAWSSWSNLYGLPYYRRRDVMKLLRGALLMLDQAAGEPQPTRPGAEPRPPVDEPFFGDDDAPMTDGQWAGMLILHAEAVHGCEHTWQARREIGMSGPRGNPRELAS